MPTPLRAGLLQPINFELGVGIGRVHGDRTDEFRANLICPRVDLQHGLPSREASAAEPVKRSARSNTICGQLPSPFVQHSTRVGPVTPIWCASDYPADRAHYDWSSCTLPVVHRRNRHGLWRLPPNHHIGLDDRSPHGAGFGVPVIGLLGCADRSPHGGR